MKKNLISTAKDMQKIVKELVARYSSINKDTYILIRKEFKDSFNLNYRFDSNISIIHN